jgi:dynein heavy chain
MNKTEDIIDLVDQDLGSLLNFLGQKKYIAYFEDLALGLTSDLRTIITLVGQFEKLQKNWNKLEPIFTQSADVKANLAETSRKFDDMNAGFKAIISEMRDHSTVKEACVVAGRAERIKELLEILDTCETELTAYLDQKKKKFPRF